jgi:hypothetical protein
MQRHCDLTAPTPELAHAWGGHVAAGHPAVQPENSQDCAACGNSHHDEHALEVEALRAGAEPSLDCMKALHGPGASACDGPQKQVQS